MKATDKAYGFDVRRDGFTRGYTHLVIDVYELDWYNRRLCSFTWQGDQRANHWYGFRVTIEADTIETVKAGAAMAAKLCTSDYTEATPEAILAACKKRGIVRTAYDNRIHDRIAVTEMADPSYLRWMDDYRALGHNSCTVDCMAKTEEEAKKLILVKLAEQNNDDALIAFIRAGHPVYTSTYDAPPTVGDIDEMLSLPAQKEAIEAA